MLKIVQFIDAAFKVMLSKSVVKSFKASCHDNF